MAHVFLSYSRKDAEYVDRIARQLEGAAFKTWVDRRGIAGGEQWRREIVAAIQAAEAMLLFLSPHSARSQNVRKELDLAETAKIKILPVALSPTDVPNDMQYQLAGVQMIELWRDRDQGVGTLIRTLERNRTQRNPALAGSAKARGRQLAPGSRGEPAGVDLSELGGRGLLDLLNIGRFFRPRNPKR